jgi:hypothetical protein
MVSIPLLIGGMEVRIINHLVLTKGKWDYPRSSDCKKQNGETQCLAVLSSC